MRTFPKSGFLKWLLSSVVVCIGIVAIVFFIRNSVNNFNNSLMSYGLVEELAKYADEHSHRLPGSWTEFANWSNRTQERKERWASGLEQKFALAWSKKASESSDKKLIFALRPDLKALEFNLNEYLYAILIAGENNAKVLEPGMNRGHR